MRSAPLKVRVHYPPGADLWLRAEPDWEADIAAVRRDVERGISWFELSGGAPHLFFKPVLRRDGQVVWAQGENCLSLRGAEPLDVFPYFDADTSCHVCDKHVVPASFEARGYEVRVFLPPGYDENTLESFPVLYAQDGQNLFFAGEAYGGRDWRLRETLAVLDSMNLLRRVIVAGIHSRDRDRDYTDPGYEAYGEFVARELKPWVDGRYRTRPGPKDTAAMGSSLGGVVSLHLGWRWPEVFGAVACLSSTFGYRDDLLERVARGPRPSLRIYLDSGWPGDNYEATRAMHQALLASGFVDGRDVLHLAFPRAMHDEDAWGARAHLPLQFLLRW